MVSTNVYCRKYYNFKKHGAMQKFSSLFIPTYSSDRGYLYS